MNSLELWKDKGLLNDSSLQKLQQFAELIFQWNSKVNLTGYKTLHEIEENLIGESVAALQVLSLDSMDVLDFGSGAGIPSLVWTIVIPSAHITSLEIRQKKIAFQKEVTRTLDVSAEILLGRFPDAVRDRKLDLIVSRAIRFSPKLWKEAEQLLKPNGKIVRFGASNAQESGWKSIQISDRTTLLNKTHK